MKIAIIGTGISGLTCAHLLSKKHDVTVFEAGDYVGGHTHTVDVKVASGAYAIDTGFIVFNDWTYPNFIQLMNQIGVPFQDSSMSFSVKVENTGLEYNGTSINTLFAQRINFLSPNFYRMIKDIMRFNEEAPRVLNDPSGLSLGEYLRKNRYSAAFKDHYIVPMGAAIWSSSADQMDQFPIEYFVRFFKNHGMLSVSERPVWKVIQGGSRSYIEPLCRNFKDKIHLNAPVKGVLRGPSGVSLRVIEEGQEVYYDFDEVVFATHSDQTKRMLSDISPLENQILSGFSYQANSTILHTDTSVLPKNKRAWAAWNYFVPTEKNSAVAVTYCMNILQGLRAPETFCVSLNQDDQIDPDQVLAGFTYYHPVYTKEAFSSQGRWSEISGKNRTHFAGAYWGYGFHEDGVKSALNVCAHFGVSL